MVNLVFKKRILHSMNGRISTEYIWICGPVWCESSLDVILRFMGRVLEIKLSKLGVIEQIIFTLEYMS